MSVEGDVIRGLRDSLYLKLKRHLYESKRSYEVKRYTSRSNSQKRVFGPYGIVLDIPGWPMGQGPTMRGARLKFFYSHMEVWLPNSNHIIEYCDPGFEETAIALIEREIYE